MCFWLCYYVLGGVCPPTNHRLCVCKSGCLWDHNYRWDERIEKVKEEDLLSHWIVMSMIVLSSRFPDAENSKFQEATP